MAVKDFTFRKRDWMHLLPVMVFWVYLGISIILKQTVNLPRSFIRWEITAALLISHTILVVYAYKSVTVLRQFTAAIKNVHSSMEKINLSWLRFVLLGFGIIWVMIITNGLFRIIWKIPIPYVNDMITVASTIMSIMIIYYGLTQPKLFSGIESKYTKSTLTFEDAQHYMDVLKEYMKREKPHLTPSLTINHLSEKLEIPAKHLSQVVNEKFQQNFFDFINSYRIEEAKEYLLRKSRSSLNISQIIYEVGFNSKAAFNRAFSKHVGMSPREFKRQSQN
jgi:AraC-like DNA-binding protein